MDWVKHLALPWVGGLHPINWWPEYKQKSQNMGEFSLPAWLLELKHCSSALGLDFRPWVLVVLKPSESGWKDSTSSPGAPACIGHGTSQPPRSCPLILFLWRILLLLGSRLLVWVTQDTQIKHHSPAISIWDWENSDCPSEHSGAVLWT